MVVVADAPAFWNKETRLPAEGGGEYGARGDSSGFGFVIKRCARGSYPRTSKAPRPG